MIKIYATSLWMPILSGILLSLTLPYIGIWPLVWIALVPLFVFASNTAITTPRLIWGGLVFGTIYAIAVIYPLIRITGWWWGGTPDILQLSEAAKHVLYAMAVGIVGVIGGSFFIPLVLLVRYINEKWYGTIVVTLCWLIVEFVRSAYALFGYSWGVLGYTLIDTQYLKHIASLPVPLLGGVYTLSLLVVLGNLAVYDFWQLVSVRTGSLALRLRNTWLIIFNEPGRYIGFWLFVFLFVLSLAFGVAKVHLPGTSNANMRVAIIPSRLPTEGSMGENAYRDYREKLLTAFAGDPGLIVLPENAFPFFEILEADGSLNENSLIQFSGRDALYGDLLSLLRTHPTTFVAVGLHSIDSDHARYNSVVIYEAGKPVAYYHKRKLVPFTEYVPPGVPLSLPVHFASGKREQRFQINDEITTTALLCSEIADTTLPLGHPAFIISPSNDSVFAGSAAPQVHHQMARMRALESGAYVLRASKGGISSIITPAGDVLMSSDDNVMFADLYLK